MKKLGKRKYAPYFEQILLLLPEQVRVTIHETTKGLLFWPNDDLTLGPKFHIRLNFPLREEEIDWDYVAPYFNGGHENTCAAFLTQCNGFAFAHRFVAPGILTHNPYDRQGLSFLNVPYDLRNLAYGSYPPFAPGVGYFIGKIRLGAGNTEVCDIVTPEGNIVYGEFRESKQILGGFDNLEEWINARVPQALKEMENEFGPVPLPKAS